MPDAFGTLDAAGNASVDLLSLPLLGGFVGAEFWIAAVSYDAVVTAPRLGRPQADDHSLARVDPG